MSNLKIGIIVADSDEYKPFKSKIEKGDFISYNFLGREGHRFEFSNKNTTLEVVSILCGIGKVNATAAAMHLVDIGCNIILNYGLSGGISGIRRGEITIPNRFLEHDFDLTGIGYSPCEKPAQKYIYEANTKLIEKLISVLPNAKIGTAVSGDRFICSEEDRNYFKCEFGAMSCDMETAAIAYVCDFANVPFIALRRISDDAGADAVENYREMNIADETLLSDYIFSFLELLCEK